MNRKTRRIAQAQGSNHGLIRFRNTSYTIDAAGELATTEYKNGNFQTAATIFQLILAKVPDSAEAYNNLGISLYNMRRYEEALASYDKAIALRPDYAKAYKHRAITLLELKRLDEALSNCNKAIAIRADYAAAHHIRACTLQEMKKYDEALSNCDNAIALRPDYAQAYNGRGLILMSKGDMREAEKMFLKAIALQPDYSTPWFHLTNMRKYQDADHADSKKIKNLLSTPRVTPLRDKDFLYFSLGKIYDDCGLYDEAFENYRQANQMLNAAVYYNANTVKTFTDNIIKVFDKDFLVQRFPFASDNASPIFIVGMPRSGTTLMASILSNHPSIATAGELPNIIEFTERLPQFTGNGIAYPQTVKQLSPALAAQFITDFLKRLRRDAGSDLPYVIDKHPLNFWHPGFISMLFPKTRIIHCTRHPFDTCLSNYFQRFSLNYSYAFDLQNIAHFYKEYERLIEHWRKVLPTPMIEVSYEDMTMNTESMARKVLDLLGLEWDERCLAPHTNPYAVETASRWQVRQPIYKKSVERWRHYEKHLQPLKEVLGMQ